MPVPGNRLSLDAELLAASQSGAPRAVAQTLAYSIRDAEERALYVAIYALDLRRGAFVIWVDTSSDAAAASRLQQPFVEARRLLSRSEGSEHPVSCVAETGEPRVFSSAAMPLEAGASTVHLFPLRREDTTIAVLRVDLQFGGAEVTSESLPLIQLIISLLLERRFVLRIFDNLPQAVDLQVSEQEYLEQLLLLIASSTAMRYVALRELNEVGDQLNTIAIFGFPSDADSRSFDLRRNVAWSELFFRVVDTARAIAVPSIELARLENIKKEMAPGVESFVVAPVAVGGSAFGTLSLGTSTEYQYSQVELLGFETTANMVGTALQNYRHFHEASENVADLRELSKSITAVELAQAARHEARVLLDTGQTELSNIQTLVSRGAVKEAVGAADRVSEVLLEVESALDRIREAQMAPVRNASLEEESSLRELFLAARTYAQGKLNSERIACDYHGPDLRVRVSKAWLRNVFANLILNSTDAYQSGRGPKRGRWISLRAERPEARAREFVLLYQDGAGGINPAELSRPRERHRTMPVEQLVFERDVTSKPTGSGYGLFIARRVIGDLGGSIELTQYRRGITLRISLPQDRLVQ